MWATIRLQSGTNPHFIRQKGENTETASGADTVEGNLSHRVREPALAAGFHGGSL